MKRLRTTTKRSPRKLAAAAKKAPAKKARKTDDFLENVTFAEFRGIVKKAKVEIKTKKKG